MRGGELEGKYSPPSSQHEVLGGKKNSPPNCKRIIHSWLLSPPWHPILTGAVSPVGPWIHDFLAPWLSFKCFALATEKHYEYLVAIAQQSKSLAFLAKTGRTMHVVFHEGRGMQGTTQAFHPPPMLLKPETSRSLHLNQSL